MTLHCGQSVRHAITGARYVIREVPAVLAGLPIPGCVRACAPGADPTRSYTIASEGSFIVDTDDQTGCLAWAAGLVR